jgi:hypothetical protein
MDKYPPVKAGDIFYRKDPDLPTHYFWWVATSQSDVIRFTFVEPNSFLFMRKPVSKALLIPAKRIHKNASFARKHLIRFIFKAEIFVTRGE